jgi:hypothetical protein
MYLFSCIIILMGDLRGQYDEAGVAFASNHPTLVHPQDQARNDQIMDDMFKSDPPDPDQVPFDLKSIVNATHATIKYRDNYGEDMYRFNIIPGGYFPGSPKTFTINNIPGEEHMKYEKETFLKEILGKPIVLTVGHQETQNLILHRDPASSDILGGVYVFESVKGEGGDGGGGGGGAASGVGAVVGSQGGGKSVRRRSRKRYSRRRRVSNKKYSASRRGRGRGRGRRSRKN